MLLLLLWRAEVPFLCRCWYELGVAIRGLFWSIECSRRPFSFACSVGNGNAWCTCDAATVAKDAKMSRMLAVVDKKGF